MKLDSTSIRRISIFCIIMQSIGIRFFGGFGILMIITVIILNAKFVSHLKIYKPVFLCILIFGILAIITLKGFEVALIVNLFLTIIASLLFLQNYQSKNRNFISDIKPVLWFFSIYGFVSWSFLVLLPGIFTKVNMGLNYSTFFFILTNLAPKDGPIPRLSSLLWEPGCAQFIFNFLLVILITQREKKTKIAFVAFLVLLTKSTTGFINLVFIAALYVKINRISLAKIVLGATIIFSVGLYSFISNNITDKVANSSGIIRTRDFYVGYELTKRHPIFGVDTQNLANNPEAQILEDEIWGGTDVWTRTHGYFAGGYTNGLMGVLLDYGATVGLLLYWLTLKAPIIWNNKSQINPYCFFIVFFCSLIGEPISRTSLFFIFALSYLVNYPDKSILSKNHKNTRLLLFQATS